MLRQTRALESLVSGEERAFSQGVDVRRVRALGLGAYADGSFGLNGDIAEVIIFDRAMK